MPFIMESIQQKDGEKKKRWFTRKKAIILGLVAFVCAGFGAAFCLYINISRNQTFVIRPSFGNGDILKEESADWFTEISATAGPFKEQRIRVSFGHGSYFKRMIEEGEIIANENQKTVLSVNREVFFTQKDGSGRFEDSVIYENHATFGKHLITNDFAFDSESLFVVDRIGVGDLPKTASNGKLDNLIKYSVSIRAEDGGELDYSYNSDRDVPLASIRSHWVTMVAFSNSDGGIRLFCLN